MLGSSSEAEDAVQDALVEALRSWPTDPPRHPRAWLLTIVRNTHVELRRFREIDDEFAFSAGEGDLTLRWWLVAHRQQWAEQAERERQAAKPTSGEILSRWAMAPRMKARARLPTMVAMSGVAWGIGLRRRKR